MESCNLVTKVDWTPFEMIRLNPVFLLLCGKVCYHMKTSLATRKLHNYKKPSSCFVFHRSLPSSATDHQGLEASCRLWWWAWSPPPTAGLRKKSDSPLESGVKRCRDESRCCFLVRYGWVSKRKKPGAAICVFFKDLHEQCTEQIFWDLRQGS